MTKRSDGYVAALVARLGGDVLITDEEAARAPKMNLKRDPATATVRIWTDAETLQGEIVTAEPQSIEPVYAVEWTPAPPVCRHCRTVH